MSSTLSITVTREKNVQVLYLMGVLDAATQDTLVSRAKEIHDGGEKDLLLDLSEVSYMGSAGFRALHTIVNMVDAEESPADGMSRHLKLLNPSEDVMKVIRTLGFDNYLEIHDRLDLAVASFQDSITE